MLDGAMGTMLQARGPVGRGLRRRGATRAATSTSNLTRPDVVRGIHAAYFDAGADVRRDQHLRRHPLRARRVRPGRHARWRSTRAAARLAAARGGRGRARCAGSAGSMGPTTQGPSPSRAASPSTSCVAGYRGAGGRAHRGRRRTRCCSRPARTRCNVKAAALGVRRALREAGVDAAADGERARSSRWARCSPARASRRCAVSLEHLAPCSIGLNCATGPEFMTDHLRSLAALATASVSVYPNAGLPDERGQYGETPARSRLQAQALPRRGLGKPGRRLLRHHAGAHRGHRRAGAGPAPARAAGRPRSRRQRRGRALSGRRQPADLRGRAHQRHRLAQVQGAGRRRAVRRRRRGRPRPR